MSDKSIARYDGPRTVDELARYSELMAGGASVLPAQFRKQPGAIMFAVEYAKALDVSPVTAITGMHIMDGKPSASAGLISALIRRAGHKLTVRLTGSVKDLSLTATAVLIRADDPDKFAYESTWDLDRAKRAGLLTITNDGQIRSRSQNDKPGQWEKYPENMLKSRVVTEVGRDGAADVLLGMAYTPEELGADVDEDGVPVYTVTQVPHSAPRDNPAPEPKSSPDPDPGAPEDPDTLADAARRAIFAARSLDPDLVAVWNGPEIQGKNDRAATLVTADEQDVETTVLDLFRKAAASIKGGSYLTAGTKYDDPPAADYVPMPDPTPGDGDAGTVSEGDGSPDDVAATGANPEPSTAEYPLMRSALDAVMRELDEADVTSVVAWCRDHGINPTQGEEACRRIVEAIRTGDALPVSFPVDPEQLLVSILGAEVVERIPHSTPEEFHAAMLANREEDRRDAAAARQATGRGPSGGGLDEYRATRAANKA